MIIALNNKSNLEKESFETYINELSNIETTEELILCPTFLNIGNCNFPKLGAQNVSTTDDGAYTGEISAKQLKSYGVDYCIIGHSERRQYQKETNENINNKIKKLFEYSITPILCIGETKEERENNKVKEVLKEEIMSATKDLTEEEKNKIIVAYEPIWSIGTGLIPTSNEIIEVLEFIKEYLPNSKLLYGGSANEENIDTLKEITQINGFLLGGLSLKPDKLKVFLNKIENR